MLKGVSIRRQILPCMDVHRYICTGYRAVLYNKSSAGGQWGLSKNKVRQNPCGKKLVNRIYLLKSSQSKKLDWLLFVIVMLSAPLMAGEAWSICSKDIFITIRIKYKKYSQKHLTYRLVKTNIYTNKTNKIFAYNREDAECLSKEKV